MKLLGALLAVAIAICHGHPGGEYREYVYPSYGPHHVADDDFAHRFRYKEYFPTPHEIGMGSGYLDSKLYGYNQAFPSTGEHFGGKAQYITSSIGHHLSNTAHAIKDAGSAVSDHIGGKISYITSGIAGHFKGHFEHKDPYAGGYGYYDGHDGYGKLGAVTRGIGEALSGPIETIKNVHAGLSDTISHTAQDVKEGISAQLSNAAHTVQVAHSDLSDHLSRSAVHVKKGISGTISDTTHTAKTLFGILSEFLGKKVQVIREGVSKQYENTKHAVSATNAAIYRHIGNKALGVGEFLQNKAHEINVSIQKKLHRDYDDAPYKHVEPIKAEVQAFPPGKLDGFSGPFPGEAIKSSYAVSSLGPGVRGAHGGAFGGAYSFHQPAHLFQPTKVSVEPVSLVKVPAVPIIAPAHYEASSYAKI